jgi:hypothetical protein
LDIDGFKLYPHRTGVRDFRDRSETSIEMRGTAYWFE